MPKPKTCPVCAHPAMNTINGHILNNAKSYPQIAAAAEKAAPELPILTSAQLSRHRTECLGLAPQRAGAKGRVPRGVPVTKAAAAITEATEGQIQQVAEKIPLADALAFGVAAGYYNMSQDPRWLTPSAWLGLLELSRKMGIGDDKMTKFEDAWAELGKRQREDKPKISPPNTVDAVIVQEPFDEK